MLSLGHSYTAPLPDIGWLILFFYPQGSITQPASVIRDMQEWFLFTTHQYTQLLTPKYEVGIASLATSNPNVYLDHIHQLINHQLSHQIILLKTELGIIVKEPEVEAELLNAFYDAVFRPDNVQPILALPILSVFPYYLLFSSIKSTSLSTYQRAQAPSNWNLSCLSGWPLSLLSPWHIYSTTTSRKLSVE